VKVYEVGGDICQTDILDSAMKGVDYVIHLAALWLLQCYEYPRAAFDVNIRGTFNVLETCIQHQIKKLIYSSSASVYGDAVESPMTEEHPFNNRTFYGGGAGTDVQGFSSSIRFELRWAEIHECLWTQTGLQRNLYRCHYEDLTESTKDSTYCLRGRIAVYDFIHVSDVACHISLKLYHR
jgi:nucleoside-diphosphate-sugar epimerase